MSIAQTAARLLKKDGEAVTFTVAGEVPAFDPVTGAPQAADPSTTFEAFGYPSRYMAHEIDGESIKAGDIRLILEKTESRPEKGSLVEVDGVSYRVMKVQPIRKAGADIIVICQLRSD